MKLSNFKLIFILVLILGSLFIVQNPLISDENIISNEFDNNQILSNLDETQENESLPNSDENISITQDAALIQDSQEEIWYQGETIRAEMKYKSNRVNELLSEDEGTTYNTGDITDTYTNDAEYFASYSFEYEQTPDFDFPYWHSQGDDENSGSQEAYIIYEISASLIGQIYVDTRILYHTTNNWYTTISTGSGQITSTHISSDFKTVFAVVSHNLAGQFTTDSIYTTGIFALDQTSLTWELIWNDDGEAIGLGLENTFALEIDQILYTPNYVIETPRYQYKYSSPTQIVKTIEIQLFEFGVSVGLLLPLSDNLTSVSPSTEGVFYDDTKLTWNFTSTAPAIYYLIINSGEGWGVDYAHEPYYLAVNDHSSDYMQSPSFESASIDDLQTNDLSSTSSDTRFAYAEISTSIVYSGAFSANYTDTDSTAWVDYIYSTSSLDADEYYISFAYYSTSDLSSLKLQWSDLSSFDSQFEFSDLGANRWHTAFVFIKVGFAGIIRFRVGADASFLLDDFFIGKSSGRVEPTGYNQFDFSSTSIVWDGLQNKKLVNKQIEMKASYRTTGTEIFTLSLTTNEQGIATHPFEGPLDPEEIEIESWSWDSKFGLNSKDNAIFSDWTPGSSTGGGGFAEETTNTLDGLAIRNQLTGASSYLNPSWDPTAIQDLSNIDYVSLYQYYHTSGSQYSYEIRFQDSLGDYDYYNALDELTVDEWGNIRIDLNELTIVSSIDMSDINKIYFRFNLGSVVGDYALYDQFSFIQSQKSYYTPSSSEYDIFSFETKQDQDQTKNYFDFSEGTADLWDYYPTQIDQGSWQRTYSGNYFYTYFPFINDAYAHSETVQYDLTGVDVARIRFYTDQVPNTENYFQMYYCDDRTDFWNNQVSSVYYTDTIGWQIIDIPIPGSLSAASLASIEQLRFTFHSNGANDFVDLPFKIDYIDFVDTDPDVNLYETDDSFIFSSQNDTSLYYYELDETYYGYATDLEYIFKNMTIAAHNFSYVKIYDASLDENLIQLPGTWYENIYEITEVETTLVHFQFTNLFGVGIDFNTVQLWINDTRIYSEAQYYSENTFLDIIVKTHFNTTILETNTTVISALDQDVILIIPWYLQYFTNGNLVGIAVIIKHTNFNTSFVLDANSSMQMYVIADTYNITVMPLVDEFRNETHILSYAANILENITLPSPDDGRIYFSLALDAVEIESDVPDIIRDNLPRDFWKYATYILGFVMTFLAAALLLLVYKLAQVVLEYTGMTMWNLTIAVFTGKKIYKRKDYIISDKKPDDNPFSAGAFNKEDKR